MSQQIFLSLFVELGFILITIFLLVRPFSKGDDRGAMVAGMFTLCFTFCWSVILGCVLALNNLTFRL